MKNLKYKFSFVLVLLVIFMIVPSFAKEKVETFNSIGNATNYIKSLGYGTYNVKVAGKSGNDADWASFSDALKEAEHENIFISLDLSDYTGVIFYVTNAKGESYSPFSKKESLVHVSLPKKCDVIPESMFFRCTSLKSIDIPSSVKTIGEKAFAGCSFKSVKLNEGLKKIGEESFSYNDIKSIEIPSTVDWIEGNAFPQIIRSMTFKKKDGWHVNIWRSNSVIVEVSPSDLEDPFDAADFYIAHYDYGVEESYPCEWRCE